jgi:hypothetical protein
MLFNAPSLWQIFNELRVTIEMHEETQIDLKYKLSTDFVRVLRKLEYIDKY